jgi:hypothetical protein
MSRLDTTRKVPFSNSPLAHPLSPIHRLASSLQDYLHFPDPYPLYALIAALVGNYAEGRPIWLMLVGPPSCGKSELLNSLLGLPRIVEGGSITGPAALLSGSGKRDRAKDATGGLLRQVGERGALVIKEFTSILSLPHESMRQTLAAFREIYDGRWTRTVGTDGARSLHWQGKLALLTGCTESIDHHHALTSDMGERFMFFRYDSSDGWGETYKALTVAHPEQLSALLQGCINRFADECGLDWDAPPELPELDTHDRARLIAFSQFSSHGRSAVIRDPYSREIVQASTGEYPIRLALALGQMLRSLRFIGVDEPDCWRIVRKLAFDSIPGSRRLALMALLSGKQSTGTIAEYLRVSQSTVRRSLEELSVHSLVDRTDAAMWRISSWAKDRLAEACNGSGLSGMRLDPFSREPM